MYTVVPAEINADSGDYKVGDDSCYLPGSEVTRLDDVPVGTKYEVYEDGKLVGTWILKSWNADSLEMGVDGMEFLGTWEFVANPKTLDNISLYFAMLLVSFIGTVFVTKQLKKNS